MPELTSPAPELLAALADEVVLAVWQLRNPRRPGTPWTVRQIAAVLPGLEEGPSSLETEAWTTRGLCAADAGELEEA